MHLAAGVVVEYSVVYPPKLTDYNPCSVETSPIPNQPVTIEVPGSVTAIEVMEKACSVQPAYYKFTATYSTYGFFINAINGIPCAVIQSPPSKCFWGFFIKHPDGTVTASEVGVSSYEFDTDGYGMIMCFTNSTSPESFEKNCNSNQKVVKNEL